MSLLQCRSNVRHVLEWKINKPAKCQERKYNLTHIDHHQQGKFSLLFCLILILRIDYPAMGKFKYTRSILLLKSTPNSMLACTTCGKDTQLHPPFLLALTCFSNACHTTSCVQVIFPKNSNSLELFCCGWQTEKQRNFEP